MNEVVNFRYHQRNPDGLMKKRERTKEILLFVAANKEKGNEN